MYSWRLSRPPLGRVFQSTYCIQKSIFWNMKPHMDFCVRCSKPALYRRVYQPKRLVSAQSAHSLCVGRSLSARLTLSGEAYSEGVPPVVSARRTLCVSASYHRVKARTASRHKIATAVQMHRDSLSRLSAAECGSK